MDVFTIRIEVSPLEFFFPLYFITLDPMGGRRRIMTPHFPWHGFRTFIYSGIWRRSIPHIYMKYTCIYIHTYIPNRIPQFYLVFTLNFFFQIKLQIWFTFFLLVYMYTHHASTTHLIRIKGHWAPEKEIHYTNYSWHLIKSGWIDDPLILLVLGIIYVGDLHRHNGNFSRL